MKIDQALKQHIITLEQKWAQAHQTLDLKTIEELLSDDYQQIQTDGSISGKQDLLDSYASGNRFWEIAECSNHHIQLQGDLAIVFGCWKGKGINTGIPFNYRARYISIYKQEINGWKMVLDRSISDSNC